jgi:hypothetical protein
VRKFHDRLRELMPVMTRKTEPAAGTVMQTNKDLLVREVA